MVGILIVVRKRLRRASRAITPRHLQQISAFARYDLHAKIQLLSPDVQKVVDVGGGRTFPYDEIIKGRSITLSVVDIDPDELELNRSAVHKFLVDICDPKLELPTGFDLALVRSGVEHFHDNAAALTNISRLLRSGGRALFVFPDRNANFALLNRALPRRVTAVLLRTLVPESEGVRGFQAHYDRCTNRGFIEAARAADLEVVEYYPAFYSFAYFSFFPPLHVLSLALDTIRFVLGSKSLATYHFFLVRRT